MATVRSTHPLGGTELESSLRHALVITEQKAPYFVTGHRNNSVPTGEKKGHFLPRVVGLMRKRERASPRFCRKASEL